MAFVFVLLTLERRCPLISISVAQSVGSIPLEIDFLFRAHRHVGTGPLVFVPDLNVTFGLEFQRSASIGDFATMLAEHLNKTQIEKETGSRIKTCFLSLSPILEWTLHKTGQKWRDSTEDDDTSVGLAIVDVKKLQQSTGISLFRVSNILEFLRRKGKDHLIEEKLQKWAQNCDEYITIGPISDKSVIRWVKWENLYSSPVIQPAFHKAYTLALYRRWSEPKKLGIDAICKNIMTFGKLLAGPEDKVFIAMVDHILKPGISFWGFQCEFPVEDVRSKIQEKLEDEVARQLSELHI